MKKVFVAQQNNPSEGDWIELVEEDMKNYNMNISANKIMSIDG